MQFYSTACYVSQHHRVVTVVYVVVVVFSEG